MNNEVKKLHVTGKLKGDKGDTGVMKYKSVPYADLVTVKPHEVSDIATLEGDIEIQLGEAVEGLDNEWCFVITQGATAYNVTLPVAEWRQLGIAPSFEANSTTEVSLYYRNGILMGVWL